MAQQRDNDDAITRGGEGVPEDGDGFTFGDAWPVCRNCFHPCNPLQDYCDNCDSNEPVNPLISYMPFVRIRFHAGMFGKVWHKMGDGGDTPVMTRVFCLIVIVLGAPVMLVIGLPLLLISKIEDAQLRRLATVSFFILLLVFTISSLAGRGVLPGLPVQ